ncbi:hypothetical protein IGI04_034504 [Brassica rapa subsp. trilocularis]|uniref:NADP-dependent oxidoreductase domain-containing protein n=1 Tax=Brassica rapa subsp. trilocularis TaxID=1813537 RepID=A0ABQ7L8X9_BRACM|nr:hypothetical protein IGI04_034504 [Brassica rapa subsp. trilocularis]
MTEEALGVRRMKLGSQGLEVSAQGLGCMGLSAFYGAPTPETPAVALLRHAIKAGITFLDTSDFYGPETNELLLGKALEDGSREKVELATKFGITASENGKFGFRGDPQYVRSACEASLTRLGVTSIDLYYQHRIDTTVPIEVTMGELKKLVEEGKIKYIGLSEASASTIRRAHAVHPLTAVQIEWSLWSREVEEDIIPTCRELGIGIVAYSPLGRGFFASGPKLAENLEQDDIRKASKRLIQFSLQENLDHNKIVFEKVQEIARKKRCTPAQLALAWVHHQGDDVCPIPGTSKIENLNQNIGALSVKLTTDEMAELEAIARPDVVKGERHWNIMATYKNSETPPFNNRASEVRHDAERERERERERTMAKPCEVRRMKLGSQGLEVSAQGLGCMGISSFYGPSKPEADAIALLHHAIDSGVTFFDTSDVYGPETNELLLGKALKYDGVRGRVELATKFGATYAEGKREVRGDPAYVRVACEASLKRLDVACIDLYYQHRVDTRLPIEITMGELKKLVEEGKIKYIGLSEASASTIRRAHAVHPVTAVQLEWSLWTRDVEEDIVPTCRELGIGIVSYSPLGRGFFASGPKLTLPRFQQENLDHNKILYDKVCAMSEKKGCTPAQLALAWVHHQGDDVCPIPGTTKIKNLNQNIGALSVEITPEEMSELKTIGQPESVKGERYTAMVPTFKNSDTPPLSSWKATV